LSALVAWNPAIRQWFQLHSVLTPGELQITREANMRSKLLAAVGTAMLVTCLTSASAADKAGQKFIIEAIQGNLAEIQMGKLAQEKGQDDATRSFGQTLVTDHSAANEKAIATAKELDVTPPTEPNAEQRALYDKLSKLSGSAFDREFARMMVSDHKKDIKEFKTEAERKNDPAAHYASESLPTLQKHLQLAEGLNSGRASSQ
jgi:putative membrane protein